MRRAIGLALVAVLIGGCTQVTGVGSPSSSGTPSIGPTPSGRLSPAPATPSSPIATVAPTPSPPPSPTAIPEPLEVTWAADDPLGLPSISYAIEVVRGPAGYVIVAELPNWEDVEYAAWHSTDGKSWEEVHRFPLGQRIFSLAAAGPGFVAAGFGDADVPVWTSADGRSWQAVQDSSLRGGVIGRIVSTAGGVVAFGRKSGTDQGLIWTSADGREWLAATNETGVTVARGLQAVGSFDGRAIAVVGEGPDAPPSVWETTGRAEWTRTGALSDETAMVNVVAGGARGWVAVGSTMDLASATWASDDGRTWSDGVSGPDVWADVIVDAAGFIAVGHVGSLPGETCGDGRPFAGHTWTSADGRTWQRMPVATEFEDAMVLRLVVVDRTLVGFGARLGAEDAVPQFTIGRWTAELPPAAAPASGSDEASEPKFCGDS